MSTFLQRAYTTAASLNNMGVTLLERHCHQEAAEAFTEAVGIMKDTAATLQEANASRHRPFTSSQSFEAKLQKFRNAIVQSQLYSDTKVFSQDQIFTSTEEGCGAVVDPVLRDGSILHSTATFLVRIELEGKSIQECECHEPHMESAILLNNLAACHRLMASSAQSLHMARRHLESAFTLFELSYSTLQNESSAMAVPSPQVLPLSILVLRSLVLLSSTLNLEVDEEAYYSEIVELGEVFLQTRLSDAMVVAAAAA